MLHRSGLTKLSLSFFATLASVTLAGPAVCWAAGTTATPPAIEGRWRLSTYATEGPKGLKGSTASYELVVSRLGQRWLLSLAQTTGPKGEPTVPETLAGAVVIPYDTRPVESDKSARRVTALIPMQATSVRVSLYLELRFEGDELTGYWEYADRKHRRALGDDRSVTEPTVFGALKGARGNGEPVKLAASTPLPCVTCCDLVYRCGPQGPSTCNSSLTCTDECLESGNKPKACLTDLSP